MQKQFLPIGLDFAKKDLRAAFLLSFLINTSDYYSQNDKDADGWFYCTADNLKERIGFTRADIQHAVTVLCAMNLLQTQKRGMPAKIYYRVNTDTAIYTNACLLENDKQVCTKTTNKFAENQQTSLHENDKQVCTNPANKFVEIQQTSLSENDSNKELINKELNNNNKNKELKEEESADFANPLPPAPKKSVSKKSKVWFSAERVNEIVFGLIQQFYPNQSKGWGDLLNEYFNNIKSAKTKSKNEAAFLKTVQRDAEKFLAYCSATQISDSTIIVYLEQAAEREYMSLTGWSGKNKGGEPVNFTTTLQGIAVLEKTHAKALSTTQQDPRNTNELIRFFVDKILTVYDKIGAVRGGEDADAIKQQHLNYYEQIKGKLSSDPAKFQEQLVWVAECLKAEYKELESKTTATYKPKGLPFDIWISKSYWENHAPIKATQIKPQQTQKIAPIAPKVVTAEQMPEIPVIVQQGKNEDVLKVLSVPTPPAKLEDKEAKYPDFYFEQEAAENRTETIQRIRHNFLVKLAKVERVMDNKRKGLIEILQLEKIYTGDDFCLFLHDVCEGFPTESDNVNAWIFLREFWDKQLAPKVCTAQKISIN